MVTIRASFIRALARLFIVLGLLVILGGIVSIHRQGFAFLALLFALLAGGSCFVHVPRSITLTDTSLSIEWLCRRTVNVPLDELEAYAHGRRFFMIQLKHHRTQSIDDIAFASDEWRAFTRELERRFPDRKASFFVGTQLFGGRTANHAMDRTADRSIL
jgi:hypothetical protein